MSPVVFIVAPILILDWTVATVDAGKIVFDIDFLRIHLEGGYLCASGMDYDMNGDFSSI